LLDKYVLESVVSFYYILLSVLFLMHNHICSVWQIGASIPFDLLKFDENELTGVLRVYNR